MRLIDADAINYKDVMVVEDEELTKIIRQAINLLIDQQPTVEKPKGKWLLKEYCIPVKQTALPTVCRSEYKLSTSPTAVESKYMYICSDCRKKYISQSNYCPYCGAEMEGEE